MLFLFFNLIKFSLFIIGISFYVQDIIRIFIQTRPQPFHLHIELFCCQAQPKLQPNWAELAIFSQFPLNLQILLHPGKVYFSFSMQCIETKPPFCHQWVIVLIKGALTPTPNQTGISFGPKLIAKSHVSRGTFRLLPSSA